MKNLAILLTALMMIGSGCKSVEKMVDRGDYDEAIIFSAKKLAGKKNKKTKYVQALEEAFRKATHQDMKDIAYLEDEGRPENWSKIVRIYDKIDDRQRQISPFLPLVSNEGYRARFDFVKVESLQKEAIGEAAEYHYKRAMGYMEIARKGSKEDARDAYNQLEDIERYYKHYKNTESLKREALDLGKTRIMVKVENDSRAIIPDGFEREILNLDLSNLNSTWKTYYMKAPGNKAIDFVAKLSIRDLILTPERETINRYIDEKEIKDGWEYVLDANGNVQKDTLGNDIKRDRFVIVRADVIEIFREKSATVNGSLELIKLGTGEKIKAIPISVTSVFEDYASSFIGDRRAICDRTRNRLKSNPLPFPSDFDMVWLSSDEVKLEFKQHLRALYL